MQGARNSVGKFQSRVKLSFASMRSAFKAWLGDFASQVKDEKTLLDPIIFFLEICLEFNLKVSPEKSVFS